MAHTSEIVPAAVLGTKPQVALVNAATGQVVHVIEDLPGPGSQATGAYNGKYAVWKESHTEGNVDDFSIREWSRATGAVTTVGGSHSLSTGQVVPSSYQDPVMNQSYAAWDEGVAMNGVSEIVVLNLRTGVRMIERRGHPGWIALTHRSLVWAESPHAGAETVVHATKLSTGERASPPAALAHIRGAWGFVQDRSRWAWIGGATEAVYSATNDGKAVRLAKIPQGGASPPVATADGVMAVPVSAGGMIMVNLRARAWTYLQNASYATSNGSTQLLVIHTTTKTAQGAAPSAIARLGQTDLSSIACPPG